MLDRIADNRRRAEELIARLDAGDIPSAEEWNREISLLLTWIGFLQHERLVHLIVLALFSLLTILSVGVFLLTGVWALIALTVLFLSLTVPYIVHYYRLENGIQRLYCLYEQLIRTKERA